MPPSQEPIPYPNNFSNGWVPHGPEPTREDYANGYGKLAMRKAMYGDMAWGMTTVTYANYRPNREPPSEGLRKFLLQPDGLPGPPVREIQKREYLLEGSVPDVPIPDATERLHIGPIQRPSPRSILPESSLWPHHASSQTNREISSQQCKLGRDSGAGNACILDPALETCHHHANLKCRQNQGITTPFPAYRRLKTPDNLPMRVTQVEDSNLNRGISDSTESRQFGGIETPL